MIKEIKWLLTMGLAFCSLRYSVDCSWYSRFQV
jgi:hypothetical protein